MTVLGIKKSSFSIDAIPLHAQVITRCENRFEYDSFREVLGFTQIGTDIVGEVALQVFQAESDK